MIPHNEFSRLRLSDFIISTEVVSLSDWEFDDRLWVGEAVGFTEWLRPQSSPHSLASIALDLETLPDKVIESCLRHIGLPLRPGMTLAELSKHLGEPFAQRNFVADRTTYEFNFGSPDPYDISCTVLTDRGLVYLVVMVPEAGPNNSFKPKPLRGSAQFRR